MSAIQEEVHRFAIEYHRNLRGKRMKGSALEAIDGVVVKRRKKPLMHFKSIGAVKKAEIEELKKAGVSRTIAENIYSHFRK